MYDVDDVFGKMVKSDALLTLSCLSLVYRRAWVVVTLSVRSQASVTGYVSTSSKDLRKTGVDPNLRQDPKRAYMKLPPSS